MPRQNAKSDAQTAKPKTAEEHFDDIFGPRPISGKSGKEIVNIKTNNNSHGEHVNGKTRKHGDAYGSTSQLAKGDDPFQFSSEDEVSLLATPAKRKADIVPGSVNVAKSYHEKQEGIGQKPGRTYTRQKKHKKELAPSKKGDNTEGETSFVVCRIVT